MKLMIFAKVTESEAFADVEHFPSAFRVEPLRVLREPHEGTIRQCIDAFARIDDETALVAFEIDTDEAIG